MHFAAKAFDNEDEEMSVQMMDIKEPIPRKKQRRENAPRPGWNSRKEREKRLDDFIKEAVRKGIIPPQNEEEERSVVARMPVVTETEADSSDEEPSAGVLEEEKEFLKQVHQAEANEE